MMAAAGASPPGAAPAYAQTGSAQITILEYDGGACRQAAARDGRDRPTGWYCLRGVARHPAGIAAVTVGGSAAVLRPDSTGGVQFTGVTDMSESGGDVAVVVRAVNGELSEGLYRLTPTPPNPAYPDLQPFAITNLRPRLLGAGNDAPAGAAGPESVAAAPLAVTEDPTRQHIRILEPREWSEVDTRGITVPGRRSVRVIGYATHPGGVSGVEIDGRPAAIRAEGGGSFRFVGFVPVDSVAREVVVMVRGHSGNPVIARYPLNPIPAAQSFASRDQAWTPASGFRGRRWALVVGISAYADTALRPLQYADDDARAIYDFLRSPRAGGGGYAEENVKLLLNDEATYAGVRNALFSFLRQATDEDHVFIYFAGHGAPDPTRPGDLYLLTHDTRSGQIPATAFPMRDVDRAVAELYARHVVVVTDACHSGGITEEGARTVQNAINDVFLAQLSSSTGGLAVFTASGADQVSLEDAQWGGGHGVFTHYLLQALEGKADEDGDQIVTLVEMMYWTIDQVRRETQNSQIPTIGSRTYDRYLPMSLVLNAEELASLAPPASRAEARPVPGAPAALRPSLADSLARAREAVALFPGSAQYRSRLGSVLLRAELRDEALQALSEAVRLEPDRAVFHAELAQALAETGQAQAAVPHLQE
ncbi:MAG TPA: caspase family protein, partial [Longimicrobium sp.]|nr:caspase family protein [Longimicrobium sp.]